MRIADEWKDFEIVDAGEGVKIERYQTYFLQRPEVLATANLKKTIDLDAAFLDNAWHFYHELPDMIPVRYKDMQLITRPTQFKHTGIFPEQAVNWDFARKVLRTHDEPVRILNLFGYTGGATLACAMEECVSEVVHVDALKSLLKWTQDNVILNQLDHKTIRTIQEDVLKFIQREKRRGRTYHGIIMDPPSFGRGPKGERWTLNELLPGLLEACAAIFDKDGLFVIVNTYSASMSGETVLETLKTYFPSHGGYDSDAIGLPITRQQTVLHCGYTARWCYDENLL